MTRAVFTDKVNGLSSATIEKAIKSGTADLLFDKVRDRAFEESPLTLQKHETAISAFFNIIDDNEHKCYYCGDYAKVVNSDGDPLDWFNDGYRLWICPCCDDKEEK